MNTNYHSTKIKNKITSICLVLFTFFILSCDRPDCNNKNPIFENNQPDSKVYKDELVKQLKNVDSTKLTYWLQKYDEKNGTASLFFHIQGDGLCAILHLTVNDWNQLENIREKKGVGRRGAEFTDLKFEINQDSLSTKFVYKTFHRIID